MRRDRLSDFALYLTLGAAAAFSAWAAHASRPSGPGRPSIEDAGPSGLKVLHTFLRESGAGPVAFGAGLSELPPGVRTLVIAAPARALTDGEVAGLRERVRRGLTLVYLMPSDAQAQPGLEAWLRLARVANEGSEAAAEVQLHEGLLSHVDRLRVGAGAALEPLDDAWTPMATVGSGAAVVARQEGAGEVWVFPSPGVAENGRLDLDDNLLFWQGVAALGPVAFDELHLRPAPSAPALPRLLPGVVQLALGALLWAWGKSRLGPPRAPDRERYRSSREHLEALARLLRRSRLEHALVLDLSTRLRRTLLERLGVPLALDGRGAAAEAAARTGLAAGELTALFEAAERGPGSVSPREYAALARTAAIWRSRLSGRSNVT